MPDRTHLPTGDNAFLPVSGVPGGRTLPLIDSSTRHRKFDYAIRQAFHHLRHHQVPAHHTDAAVQAIKTRAGELGHLDSHHLSRLVDPSAHRRTPDSGPRHETVMSRPDQKPAIRGTYGFPPHPMEPPGIKPYTRPYRPQQREDRALENPEPCWRGQSSRWLSSTNCQYLLYSIRHQAMDGKTPLTLNPYNSTCHSEAPRGI